MCFFILDNTQSDPVLPVVKPTPCMAAAVCHCSDRWPSQGQRNVQMHKVVNSQVTQDEEVVIATPLWWWRGAVPQWCTTKTQPETGLPLLWPHRRHRKGRIVTDLRLSL